MGSSKPGSDLVSNGSITDPDDVEATSNHSQYKIYQLDWYEVEAKINRICHKLIKPTSDTAHSTKIKNNEMQTTITKMVSQIDSLNNAVFYERKSKRNVFNEMKDKFIEIKAMQEAHVDTV